MHNKHAVRIAHRQLISQDITISELGWFGGIGPSTDASKVTQNILFSRVVLDQPISLLAGEYFQAVYEIELDFGGEISGEFQNLTDQDNKVDPLKFLSRPYIVPSGRSTSVNSSNGLNNCFDVSYNRSSAYGAAGEFHLPVAYATGVRNWPTTAYVDGIFYNTNDRDFTAESTTYKDTNVTPIFNTSGDKSVEFVDYTGIGNNDKHRDMIWKIGALCPNLNLGTFVDFRFLRLRGREYRFGYYEEDGTTWHPQALRKFGNQILKLTFRTRYITEDTVQ